MKSIVCHRSAIIIKQLSNCLVQLVIFKYSNAQCIIYCLSDKSSFKNYFAYFHVFAAWFLNENPLLRVFFMYSCFIIYYCRSAISISKYVLRLLILIHSCSYSNTIITWSNLFSLFIFKIFLLLWLTVSSLGILLRWMYGFDQL